MPLIIDKESADEVLTVLHTSTEAPGSKYTYFGTGRINAYRALNYIYGCVAKFDTIIDDGSFGNEIIPIYGTAKGDDFYKYNI